MPTLSTNMHDRSLIEEIRQRIIVRCICLKIGRSENCRDAVWRGIGSRPDQHKRLVDVDVLGVGAGKYSNGISTCRSRDGGGDRCEVSTEQCVWLQTFERTPE